MVQPTLIDDTHSAHAITLDDPRLRPVKADAHTETAAVDLCHHLAA
jgi:hypothetical protein